tara:strand:+ start:1305 stop:1559 length:255 start_codon:yes stop_codon:yes gene_type:complete
MFGVSCLSQKPMKRRRRRRRRQRGFAFCYAHSIIISLEKRVGALLFVKRFSIIVLLLLLQREKNRERIFYCGFLKYSGSSSFGF